MPKKISIKKKDYCGFCSDDTKARRHEIFMTIDCFRCKSKTACCIDCMKFMPYMDYKDIICTKCCNSEIKDMKSGKIKTLR